MPPPLPLAPRPYPGEAVSSWVTRIAARYDVLADDLVGHVLGWRSTSVGRAERLDHHTDAELEAALAKAARIPPATISNLRIVGDDGSTSCWHRTALAWCPECIRGDLAQHGEIYERAMWRLGCCVLCPRHQVPLEDTCRRCMAEARCHFQCADGFLRLACNTCGRLVDPAVCPERGLEDGGVGAFGVCFTPPLSRLVGDLQSDLQAALAGSRPRRAWGFVRSAKGLLVAVRDLTLCIILATRMTCEPRIELPEPKAGQAFAPVHEPITLAALPQFAAYGVLAIAAAMLRSLEGGSGPRHHWRPDGLTSIMNASSFVAWLPADERRRLRSWATTWERPAGDALGTVLAMAEGVA